MNQLKLVYFLFFAGAGCMVPYLAPYLHQRGLDDGQVGLIFGSAALSMLITPLLVGVLADARVGPVRLFRWGGSSP